MEPLKIILFIKDSNLEFFLDAMEMSGTRIQIVEIYTNIVDDQVIEGQLYKSLYKISEVLKVSKDIIFVDDDLAPDYKRVAEKLQADRVIGSKEFLDEYFPGVQELEIIKEHLRRKYINKYESLTIGDFTYGIVELKNKVPGLKCTIGKFCSIASNVKVLLGIDHRTDWNSTYPFNVFVPSFHWLEGNPTGKGDVIIGNDVWLGDDVSILSGVEIGDGAVIATGAVVTKSVPPYTVAGGVPAKVIKKRFSEETIDKLLEMKWWDWDIKKIADAIPLLQSSDFEGLYNYYLKNIVK